MSRPAAICVQGLSHWYGSRQALREVGFDVAAGEIFGLLGPNGGGKTTLFRVLATLLPVQLGTIQLLGFDVAKDQSRVRGLIGVTFQSPSLDKKLTVRENLVSQGYLYGLSGTSLRARIAALLEKLGLTDRAGDRAESLSGGLARRVEIAKGLLHNPQVLLLDEPSTGLDPGARADLWSYLQQIRREEGVTVVLTTHLLEEAEKADRLAILDEGKLVALDTPDRLRATVGGDSLTIQTDDPQRLAAAIRERFDCEVLSLEGSLRLERPDGHEWVARLVEAFPGQIQAITLGKPTLEDVFIARTGHRFWRAREEVGIG
jgi:ABC-2 type transport system ATP-binding protein